MADTQPLLAVLIDADNIPAKHIDAIFAEITSFGEPSVRRVYGDFSSSHLKKWSEILAEHAIVPIHQPANTVGKNASDIALVIDGMDLLHSGRVDGFVLVSSDSDFTRLASRIREQGLPVYGIGERKTPSAFRMACKRFVFIENISRPVENDAAPPEASMKQASLLPTTLKSIVEKSEKEHLAARLPVEPPSKSVPLIIAAMRSIDTEDGWYSLGPIGQKLMVDNPDFDSRSYGCPNLSTLLEKTGAFTVDRANTTIRVRRETIGKNP